MKLQCGEYVACLYAHMIYKCLIVVLRVGMDKIKNYLTITIWYLLSPYMIYAFGNGRIKLG